MIRCWSLLLLAMWSSACNPCEWPYRCPYPGYAPAVGIASDQLIERRAGYAGELWWLPAASSTWLLDGEVTLESEIVTMNASAVRVPTGPRFGYDHSLAAGDVVFDVDYMDGETPESAVVAADLDLVALAVEQDPGTGEPIVAWSAGPYSESFIVELWEGDVELAHGNAVLTIPNHTG